MPRPFTLLCALLPAAVLAQAPKAGSLKTATVPIKTGDVVARTVERSVAFSGSLASPEDATLGAEVEGKVVEVLADLGDAVAKGQVLARINPDEYLFRKTQAETAQAQAEANLRRAEDLAKLSIVSASALEEARTHAARAVADADLARKRYRDTEVRAPFPGSVAKRLVSTGEYLKVGQPVFQLVMINPLKLSGEVPERYLGEVKAGSAVSLALDAFPGRTFEGRITRVAPAVNPQSRAFTVEARVLNPGGILKPGVFASARVSTGSEQGVLAVPEAAVTAFAGVTKVFLVEGGVVRERPVAVERRLPGGLAVIRGPGLKAGQKVAVSGLSRLAEGVAVTVLP
jgi:membrane fusion protein (multidrug efflux system)